MAAVGDRSAAVHSGSGGNPADHYRQPVAALVLLSIDKTPLISPAKGPHAISALDARVTLDRSNTDVSRRRPIQPDGP
jgi:hypothetical protein